jgi:acyl-CoA thioesterase
VDAEQIAQACADTMYADDRASVALGIEMVDVSVGRTVMAMTVREDMVNSHDICHGGLIFTLADSAFAFACNSENHNTVAAGARVEFLAPGRAGIPGGTHWNL